VLITGTRPEIIKLAPIIKEIKSSERYVVFSGQHYDFNLGLHFFEELKLPQPDFKLKIGKRSPTAQISQIISKLEPILMEVKPDTVMVQGDTNTALAASICALKTTIPVNHVEAGLRSHDWRMPEEHNRISIDHISELLFAPTTESRQNLIEEKVHGKSFITGNTVMDSIRQYSKWADRKSTLVIDEKNFILFTMHRAENVDDKETISNVFSALIESKERIIIPIHPRTLKRLNEFGIYRKICNANNIILLKSVGYFDIMNLMKKCDFIISDSGGIQEEVTSPFINKKVLVIRKTTDRPESVHSGFSVMVGTNKNNILNAIRITKKNPIPISLSSPYGKGDSAKRIVSLLKRHLNF